MIPPETYQLRRAQKQVDFYEAALARKDSNKSLTEFYVNKLKQSNAALQKAKHALLKLEIARKAQADRSKESQQKTNRLASLDANFADAGMRPFHIAKMDCAICKGAGQYFSRGGVAWCLCVWRYIFRECLRKKQEWAYNQDYHFLTVNRHNGPANECPRLEFSADMDSLARRCFAANPKSLRLYREYHLQDSGWKSVARLLKLDRGNFFHLVYKVEAALGKMYFENELFPIDKYTGVKLWKGDCGSTGAARTGERAVTSHARTATNDKWLGGGNYADYVASDQFNAELPAHPGDMYLRPPRSRRPVEQQYPPSPESQKFMAAHPELFSETSKGILK